MKRKIFVVMLLLVLGLTLFPVTTNNIYAATANSGTKSIEAASLSTSVNSTTLKIKVTDTYGIGSIVVKDKNGKTINVTVSGKNGSTSRTITLKNYTLNSHYHIYVKNNKSGKIKLHERLMVKKNSKGTLTVDRGPRINILGANAGCDYAFKGTAKNPNVIYAIITDYSTAAVKIKLQKSKDGNKGKQWETVNISNANNFKFIQLGTYRIFRMTLPKNQDTTLYRLQVTDKNKKCYSIETFFVRTKTSAPATKLNKETVQTTEQTAVENAGTNKNAVQQAQQTEQTATDTETTQDITEANPDTTDIGKNATNADEVDGAEDANEPLEEDPCEIEPDLCIEPEEEEVEEE